LTDTPSMLEIHQIGWQWFQTHAQQRMQILGFWFVSMSFLTTAAVLAYVNGRLEASLLVQICVLVSSVLFLLFDLRTRELIGYGESLMATVESKIAAAIDIDEIAFVAQMHSSKRRTISYRLLLTLLYGTAMAASSTTSVLTIAAM
jgi:apolipoprotein N-acyltransferase